MCVFERISNLFYLLNHIPTEVVIVCMVNGCDCGIHVQLVVIYTCMNTKYCFSGVRIYKEVCVYEFGGEGRGGKVQSYCVFFLNYIAF